MSLIDNFFSRMLAPLSVFCQYLVARGTNKRIIGVNAEVVVDEIMVDFPHARVGRTKESVYFSMSPPPYYVGDDPLFDDYGIPDDDIYGYYANVKEVVGHCLRPSSEGWRILSCELVLAGEELLDDYR